MRSVCRNTSPRRRKGRGALGESLGLPEDYRRVLVLAARLHDEGKRAKRWQRAAGAPDFDHDYAKTTGPFRSNELNGYRHEFGSLPYVERDEEFAQLSLSCRI